MINCTGEHTGTIFFLHGQTETGESFKNMITERIDFSFEHLNVIFPTSPVLRYTPRNRERINVWFDRTGSSIYAPEELKTLSASARLLKKNIIDEINTNRLYPNRIIFGGYSMGGGMALYMGYGLFPSAAGVFTISSYLSEESVIYECLTAISPPLFMSHGEADDFVLPEWGKLTYRRLIQTGIKGDFKIYPNVKHEVSKEALEDAKAWINTIK